MILAMFMNTAIDQQIEQFTADKKRAPNAEEHAALRARALSTVRGTVQADILKEDQGQNTCIFSTEFALKMMGDIQQYFVEHRVQNFRSEEHTSELQSLMRISYAVFCLKKKKTIIQQQQTSKQ